jgi:acyl carrier protein
MARAELVEEVKTLILDAVQMKHVDRATIHADTSLRNGGLELDSVDILEVVIAIEQRYQVKVDDAEAGRAHFRTIGTIADFVESQGKK